MVRQLSFSEEVLETRDVTVRKGVPKLVFRMLHRLASATEKCDLLPNGNRVWNENATLTYSQDVADTVWSLLQDGALESVDLELPVKALEKMGLV